MTMTVPLPDWLGPMDGKPGSYIADPDLAHPAILGALGIKPKDATRYDIETSIGVMKKLAQWHTKGGRGGDHGFCGTLLIRGDEGRKESWRVAGFPVGNKPDVSAPGATAGRNAATREAWARLMG